MIYLIPDTNQWIYLASCKDPHTDNFQEGNHFRLLAKLNEFVQQGEVTILINDIILNEWQRHREDAQEFIKKLQQRKEKELLDFRKMKERYPSRVTEIEALCREAEKKYNEEIQKNEGHVNAVENLLTNSENYEISKDVKADVVDWAIARKAPFIGQKKNSVADAAILFGAVACIESKAVPTWNGHEFPMAYFVSGNTTDFAAPDSRDNIHSDLQPILERVGMRFSRSLPNALAQIDQTILNIAEMLEMEREMAEWDYLASKNTAECLECTPGDEQKGLNIVRFSDPEEISNESPYIDPLQLEIPFTDLDPPERKVVSIQLGWCEWCSASHMKCSCGDVISIEYLEDEEIFECEHCGIRYTKYHVHDGNGHVDEVISLTRKKDEPIDEDNP